MSVLSSTGTDAHDTGPQALGAAALFVLAMAVGAALGSVAPATAERVAGFTDATLLTLIFLLFIELRLGAVAKTFGNLKFMAVAWAANFLIVPIIGFGIASLLLSGQPLLFAGLMIYLLAPCTDWFLGFTRMAGGDTELGAALIPVNMISQLLLFPVWLWLFTPGASLVDFGALPMLLFQWFVVPMAMAQGLRVVCERCLSASSFERLIGGASRVTPLVLALLIIQLFAGHVGDILGNAELFMIVALAVILFFALTFAVGRLLSALAALRYEEHALLAMTMAARNAPLMLALTALALPDQPLVLAVIAFGMLVEIPHLTLLRQLLLRQRSLKPAQEAPT